MPSPLFQQLLAQAKSGYRPAPNRQSYAKQRRNSGGADGPVTYPGYQDAMRKWKEGLYARMQPSIKSEQSKLMDALAQQKQTNTQRAADAHNNAINAAQAQRDQLAEQAKATLSSPANAPITVPTLAPVAPLGDVGLDASQAGANAATSQFYVAPESSASQFTLGAPIGGGNIGQRTRQSSRDITSETDNLGAKRKDEL